MLYSDGHLGVEWILDMKWPFDAEYRDHLKGERMDDGGQEKGD